MEDMKDVFFYIRMVMLFIFGLVAAPFIAYIILMYLFYALIFIDKLFS